MTRSISTASGSASRTASSTSDTVTRPGERFRKTRRALVGVAVAWRQGRSLPYGDGPSFGALAEAVRSELGVLETDGALVILDIGPATVADIVGRLEACRTLVARLGSIEL